MQSKHLLGALVVALCSAIGSSAAADWKSLGGEACFNGSTCPIVRDTNNPLSYIDVRSGGGQCFALSWSADGSASDYVLKTVANGVTRINTASSLTTWSGGVYGLGCSAATSVYSYDWSE